MSSSERHFPAPGTGCISGSNFATFKKCPSLSASRSSKRLLSGPYRSPQQKALRQYWLAKPTLWESIRLASPSHRGKKPFGRRQRTEFDYPVRELPSIVIQKTVRQLIEAYNQLNRAQDLLVSIIQGQLSGKLLVADCGLHFSSE